MPFAFGIMKLAVPRPVRRGLYRRYFEREINQNATVQTIFENIYNRNWWQSGESRSGTGSELAQTNELSRALEGWLVRHAAEISTVLDAPCGDFNWMRGVSLPGNMHYIGGDIVRELVALNSARFQSPRRTFIELDIIDGPLPTADAWLCRDALIHFPYSAGIAVLSKFRSSSIKYFLGTTYTNVENRQDIPFGMWRPINLVVHPFNLGEPFELIAAREQVESSTVTSVFGATQRVERAKTIGYGCSFLVVDHLRRRGVRVGLGLTPSGWQSAYFRGDARL